MYLNITFPITEMQEKILVFVTQPATQFVRL